MRRQVDQGSMKRYLLIAELVLSGLLLPPSGVAAQDAWRPSTEQCRAAATALTHGARDGTGWERLVDCGDIAGNALASALHAARSETDVDYLARLYSAIARVRHPAVFTSTLDVMRDPAASVPARATAILMALSQHEPGRGLPPSVPFREAVTSSAGEGCQLVRFGRTLYRSSTPLPADYREQLVNATEQLGSAPTLVRALAGCASRAVRRDLGVNSDRAWTQTHNDSAAVAAVVERYHRALTKGDSIAALAQLAEDAVIMESGSLESREEYRSHHLPADMAFARAVNGTRSPLRVSVRGDAAWTTATSTTRGRFQGKSVRSAGAELMVLTRGKDGWKISAIHWSSRDRP